jgi:hypothetical protein
LVLVLVLVLVLMLSSVRDVGVTSVAGPDRMLHLTPEV